MMDISKLDGREKIMLTCLYFAQLSSDDPRYAHGKCADALRVVAGRYGMGYGNAKNSKDAFDAMYDNGRKGWMDRPLNKRSRYLYEIYEKYKAVPFDDLEKAAGEIINEAKEEGKPYFSIRTKEAAVVNRILAKESSVEFGGLNVLQESLKAGQVVFIVLGGDKPTWDTGLAGMGVISREPYDVGYDKRNYKISVDIKLLLDKPIKREDLVPYRETYGIIGIGPIIKWEPNQALSQIAEKNAIALMRAMLELNPEVETELTLLAGEDILKRVKGAARKMVEIEVFYEESIQEALQNVLGSMTAGENGTPPYEAMDEIDEEELDAAYGEWRMGGKESTGAYGERRTDGKDSDQAYEKPCFKTGFAPNRDFARNRIVFGAPGTGKSYLLQKDCEYMIEKYGGAYERVTFYPDYMYSQFVGTYKPVSGEKGTITYEFVPGPFMRVYVKALKSGRSLNPMPHILLIEEINRAKAAAVFGNLFQLLDRDAGGVSEYDIEAGEDMKQYLAKELGGRPEHYARIKIPDNMFLWASMNSADQGVFPMDTAFKRRWSFEYLGIDENDSGIRCSVSIGSGGDEVVVDWNRFRKAINDKLSREYKMNEDKLLGPYFLTKDVIRAVDGSGETADRDKFIRAFKDKVIMYLYEDAAKQYRHKLFSGTGCNSSRYSTVCDAFDRMGMRIFGDDFQAEFYDVQEG